MAVDKGDYHFDDAGSWEKACRHMALFLWWALERGLGSSEENEIDVAELARSPTEIFLSHCDGNLGDIDFNEEGQRFFADEYDAYLNALSERADHLSVGAYEIPENDETKGYFFEWLDGRLAAWRKKRS